MLESTREMRSRPHLPQPAETSPLDCPVSMGPQWREPWNRDPGLWLLYPIGYNCAVNSFLRTNVFNAWLRGLGDFKAKANILSRIMRAEAGNFGDVKSVGDGVSEMRVDVGPGYRVYYMRDGLAVYVLLAGGDKSTQARDIKQAIELANELRAAKAATSSAKAAKKSRSKK